MPLFDLFWAMLWFFLFIAWLWVLFSIFADVLRSDDLSGWAKALWTLLIIFFPILGVLIYLIVRGRSMQERSMREAEERDRRAREYIKDAAAGSGSTADEIDKLSQLRRSGVLTEEEFQAQKARLLAAS